MAASSSSVDNRPVTPPDALLRLVDIVGRRAVTEEEAARNRAKGKGPKRAREAIPALVKVSPSTWWSWSASPSVPIEPVRIAGATFWRARDVFKLAANDATHDADAEAQP